MSILPGSQVASGTRGGGQDRLLGGEASVWSEALRSCIPSLALCVAAPDHSAQIASDRDGDGPSSLPRPCGAEVSTPQRQLSGYTPILS